MEVLTSKSQPPREYYRPHEFAKKLGVSVRTVRRWMEQGKIRYLAMPGNQFRIPTAEIQKMER